MWRRRSEEEAAVERAQRVAAQAANEVARVGEEVRTVGDGLAGVADAAGLGESVTRYLPQRDLDALGAEHGNREERFGHLRELRTAYDGAARVAEGSAQAVDQADRAHAGARQAEAEASGKVEWQVELLCQQIRDWAEAVTVARCEPAEVERWCDLVADLTMIDEAEGAARPGPSVVEQLRVHTGAAREGLVRQREELRLRQAPLLQRRDEVDTALAAVRERPETAPFAPELWRRWERPELDAGLGAPLWRLVNPAEGVGEDRLATVEAALGASGLLDAWLAPDGTLSTVDGKPVADVQPVVSPSPAARNLLAVLEPDTAGGVSHEVVRRVLRGFGWFDTRPDGAAGDWLAGDGGWRIGGLSGMAEPAGPASYVGAAAREAARQREIARLTAELSELDEQLEVLATELGQVASALETLDAEQRALPTESERELNSFAVTLAERARHRLSCARELDRLQREHDANLTRRDEDWARFAEYAGTHRFGLHALDEQAVALREFGSRLTTLRGRLDLLAAREDSAAEAERRLAECEAIRDAVLGQLSQAEDDLGTATVRLRTAESALDTDSQAQLHRRDELDAEIGQLDRQIDDLNTGLTEAKVEVAKAATVLEGHEQRRGEAEQARDTAMAALWAAVDTGLAEPLELPLPERRGVQPARELAATARRTLSVRAEAADEDKAWRRCYGQMQELRQQLLPNRDVRVLDEEDTGGIQQLVILADPAAGWQAPHLAADALAERVRDQREGYDAEQQRVLTTLLGSTFIEHLKDRLDYTTRTFARINDQLARHPTRHGNVVRVQWEADPADPDASAVVTALGRGYDELSPERQDMVRSFLARKIDEARGDAAAGGAADWKDELARALDYRCWLRLSLQRRTGSGSPWSTFDAAKHAAKSGGEKVVLLSQPLFAAAVVAYDAAGAHAPRWVFLDEAMTGVDAAVKASFMGLTVDFELDVMLTAHDEWCKYATVPAVAVYDLYRHEHLPGVDVLPYLWCGGELSAVDADRLGVVTGRDELPAEGLFGDFGDEDG
ncbi:putative exonuclease SbcCD C subunit [Amycolatopsis cihanbeyliensis]|uniref:Putative exonuclease SbcCD C subunit n=2 Tax=Amycolatopsis cihanbeyliensis TaxID=1128664 RepID=A0A542DGR6_AMYCI|nr:putative exonuclease SbcCD C subunit [Amycolatopsis cihanbeyliensis]